jgi:chromosome transmission fidelity protein 1
MVVGLPFPNLETPEWKAKMQYLDSRAATRGEYGVKASREHAENVCMRAVNQAIGRAIRHKGDWASILLFDARYAQQRVQTKLPGWIQESLPVGDGARDGRVVNVARDVAQFFDSRQS